MGAFLKFFDIRKGEMRKSLLMFFYFFLTITVLYVLKPVRSSLFLEELGSKNLRYVYLGEGVFLILVTWAYVQLSKILPRKYFFPGILFFFISNLAVFWALFRLQVPSLSAYFYIWVACFSITSVTQFWMLANDIFDPLEAKRLFGLIISGGSAGGILGGLLTRWTVRWIRTEDLLLFSAVLLGVCVFLLAPLWKQIPAASARPGQDPETHLSLSTRKVFFTSPYLWMLAGVVLFAKAASTMVDNQFNALVEINLIGKEAKTAFFGTFSAGLNALSFLMQLCATSAALRYLGVGISLMLLPVGLGMGSLATFLFPMLAMGTSLKVFDGAMNYSVQQAAKEMLYLPLSPGVRYRAKPVIDMLIYRLSKSTGGLLIILLAPVFAIPNEKIGILVFTLVPFWIFLLWKMKGSYFQLLKNRVTHGKTGEAWPVRRPAPEVLGFLSDEKSFSNPHALMQQPSGFVRKAAAAACLVYQRSGKNFETVRKLTEEIIRRDRDSAAAGLPGSPNPGALKKEISREAAFHQNMGKIRKFYLLQSSNRKEFVEVGLSALAAESLERLFRHWAVLYPGESLPVIYEKLTEHPGPDSGHSHAVELLHCLTGPEFSGIVEKLFEEPKEISRNEAVSILEDMLSSPDPCTALPAKFMVTEFGFENQSHRLGTVLAESTVESLDF